MDTRHFSIIAAMARGNRGIGKDGKLPWKNKTDMKYFKNITTQRVDEKKFNAVIMGRRTFESLGGRLLQNRINICISSKREIEDKYDCLIFSSLDEALYFLYGCPEIENIFVIGGEMLFKEAIEHNDCRELLLNEINCDVECDTFFPIVNEEIFKLNKISFLGEGVTNNIYVNCNIDTDIKLQNIL